MMKRWQCPICQEGKLAPTKPRNNDVRRFCLTCSKKTGKLVERLRLDKVRLATEKDILAAERAEKKKTAKVVARAARKQQKLVNKLELRELKKLCRQWCKLKAWDAPLKNVCIQLAPLGSRSGLRPRFTGFGRAITFSNIPASMFINIPTTYALVEKKLSLIWWMTEIAVYEAKKRAIQRGLAPEEESIARLSGKFSTYWDDKFKPRGPEFKSYLLTAASEIVGKQITPILVGNERMHAINPIWRAIRKAFGGVDVDAFKMIGDASDADDAADDAL